MAARLRRLELPLLWLTVAVLPTLVAVLPSAPLPAARPGASDVYVLQAHFHLAIPYAILGLLFAAFYGLTTGWRIWLGRLHAGLVLAGICLFLLSQVWLKLSPPPDTATIEAFAVWNRVTTTGYLLVWSGMLVFVALLVDWARRCLRGPGAEGSPTAR